MAKRKAQPRQKTAAQPKRGRSVGSRLRNQQVDRGPKNRRKRREALAGTVRAFGRIMAKIMVMALTAGVLLGGWSILSTSQAFAVRQTRITGLERVCRLDVLRAAGIGIDSNLLVLRPAQIEKRIERLPWIKKAEVSRSLPRTVNINVVERKCRVLAMAGGRIFCLDAQFRPFAQTGPDPSLDMPLITGLTEADLVQPDQEISKLMRDAANLMAIMPRNGLPGRKRLSEIHLDRVWGVSLVFDGLGATVRLGFDDYGRKLRQMVSVIADLEARGEIHRTTLIDLDYDNRAVVRLARGN